MRPHRLRSCAKRYFASAGIAKEMLPTSRSKQDVVTRMQELKLTREEDTLVTLKFAQEHSKALYGTAKDCGLSLRRKDKAIARSLQKMENNNKLEKICTRPTLFKSLPE